MLNVYALVMSSRDGGVLICTAGELIPARFHVNLP